MNIKIKKMIYRVAVISSLLVLGLLEVVSYSESTIQALANDIIRFHVVANSDTTADQLLKQQVRDEVIAFMEPVLKDSNSIQETREMIKENMSEIEAISRNVVKKWNRDYDIYVTLDYANFPTKSYGDIVFPAGEYEACRIIIGEGKGENWWCVMFPPLCYVDAATGVVPLEGKEQLKNELNKNQYELVANREERPYQVKFKIVEVISSYLHKSNYKER